MRKGIVLLLVAAVLLVGGVAALFETVDFTTWEIPAFDPVLPGGGGDPPAPDGDPLPDGPT